jgi:hypothetical protein
MKSIPWCEVPQTIHNSITPLSHILCPKFYSLKYLATRPKEKGFTTLYKLVVVRVGEAKRGISFNHSWEAM